jgi:hypothetical protein
LSRTELQDRYDTLCGEAFAALRREKRDVISKSQFVFAAMARRIRGALCVLFLLVADASAAATRAGSLSSQNKSHSPRSFFEKLNWADQKESSRWKGLDLKNAALRSGEQKKAAQNSFETSDDGSRVRDTIKQSQEYSLSSRVAEKLSEQLPSRRLGSNAIVEENSKQGSDSSEWDLAGPNAGDTTIQGFATDISVNRGETVRFKIDTIANSYSIMIYRLGSYGGKGARLIGNGIITATLPQTQPPCDYDSTTKTTDCGNWGESASWSVPPDAVSGIYIAKLTNTASSSGSSHIVFIVRDDSSSSDLLFQTSDTTWQAYNTYGESSLYVNQAFKVSYNRPFFTRDGTTDCSTPSIPWFAGWNVMAMTSHTRPTLTRTVVGT